MINYVVYAFLGLAFDYFLAQRGKEVIKYYES